MKPKHRELFIRALARETLKALGVNGENPTPEQILDHSICQACIELEAVEGILGETSMLMFVVQGIRLRLELAQAHNETLAELAAEDEVANG